MSVSPSESVSVSVLQLCFIKHPFRRTVPLRLHEKTIVIHRPPATLPTQGKSRLLLPPRISLLPSSLNGASSPKPSRRVLLHLPNPSAWVRLTISAVPVAVTSAFLCFVRSPTAHHRRHQDSMDRHSWEISHNIPIKAPPVRPHSQLAIALTSSGTSVPSTSTPTLQPQVSPTQVGTHLALSAATHKRTASTALAGTHSVIGADPRAGRGPFPKHWLVVLPTRSHSQC